MSYDDPDHQEQLDALQRKGRSLYHQRKYAEARDTFSSILKVDPTRGEAWAFRALSRILLPEANLPLADLDQALALLAPPSDTNSQKLRFILLNFRAAALHQIGQYTKTVADLEAATLLGALDAHDLMRLGASYRALGQSERALAAYHQAFLDPERDQVSPNLLLEAAQDLMELGDSHQAIEAAQTILRKQPGNVAAWEKQARALLALKQYKESMESAERAVDLNDHAYFAWGVKATALRGLKRYDEARAAYHHAYLLAPNPQARKPAYDGEFAMLLRLGRLRAVWRLLLAEVERRLCER